MLPLLFVLYKNKKMSIKKIISVSFFALVSGCATVPSVDNNSHPQVEKLHKAMQHYAKLKHESWRPINEDQVIKPNTQNPALPEIKKRLVLMGDWPSSCHETSSSIYDGCFKSAVSHFQKRHGLKNDGYIGKNTLKKLNMTPSERLNLMQKSLTDWKALPNRQAPSYLLVNIPSYELKAINKGQTDLSMRVVVGKPSWQTPTLDSEVKTIVLNPGWNVPVNITEKEIIHKVLENPNYLEEHNLKIVENWQPNAKEINPRQVDWSKYAGPEDMPYRLVQEPGDQSALGRIKFIFPNKDYIYLHDTPLKSFFSLPNRDLSHGCIRLEQPMKLLEYLSETNPKLNAEKIAPYMESKKTKYLALNKNMPLHITYINSWVDDDGEVQFRDDIYKKFQAQTMN